MLQQIYQSTIEFEKRVKKADRKNKGQFFTPLSVAEYMASLSLNISEELRVLDCGSGSGILAGALLDKLLENVLVKKVIIDLYENDNVILSTLRENTELMVQNFRENNKELIVNIIEDNFILSNKEKWEDEAFVGVYDIIIANPPYKKLTKDSDESQAMLSVVYGQPNIYFLFMALSTKLLKKDGEMVFITPRSFTSGAYFIEFREYWLKEISLTHIHIFTSRTDVFNKEEVLQEAIITRAVKNNNQRNNIEITASNDVDFEHSQRFSIDYNTVVDLYGDNKYILIPSSKEEVKALETVHRWNYNLPMLGFRIKTGPVVDFRSREWIRENPDNTTVPLLYAGHYNNYFINFPLEKYKEYQYIVNIPETQSLMLENKNYLLIKRLTAKEESRRLQCAIYLKENYQQFDKIGIENHLNYLTKIKDKITQDELYGLFCLFNTSILDVYYRIMNGNTQVNATEVNAIPLPDLDTIKRIGRELLTKENMSTQTCDTIIDGIINKGGIKVGKLQEAKAILKAIGMPKQQYNDRSAYVLLALAGIKESDSWSNATKPMLRIVDMMGFMAENYGKIYKPNTRETIRKDTIHQFRDGAVVESNTDDMEKATNSPRYSYCLSNEMLDLIKSYNTTEWAEKLNGFVAEQGTLIEKYSNQREMVRIPILINGEELSFSPGDHNQLQKAIIEELAPRFAKGAEVLYVGDTEDKDLIKNVNKLRELGVEITDHDKLPDVVLYVEDKNWLYFIESVTSVGPISQKRMLEIEAMTEKCDCGKIYITAFLDKTTFKKFVADLAWETEIWLAEAPDHMIHLNGDRFIGPR